MIHTGVYYRKYGNQVYVRDVRRQKDYLFNGIVGDILDCFQKDDTSEGLIAALREQYDVEAFPDFEKDIYDFLTVLKELDILSNESDSRVAANMETSASTAAKIAKTKKSAPMEKQTVPVSEIIRQECMEKHRLFSVSLELTYRCSEKCIHCYIDDTPGYHQKQQQELSLEDYRLILDQLRNMGCMQVLLTGGEVCMRKDFLDIAEYAVEKGFVVDIYTNGISMTDDQFDRLTSLPLNSVSFSLYGGTAEVHDRITRVPGSFEKTVYRMMMTKCAGMETYIKTVVMKDNAEDYENLMKLGKRLKIRVASSLMITPTHMGRSADPFRLNDIDGYTQILNTEFHYQPFEEGQFAGERTEDSPVCGCGQYILSINPYGDVYPCVAMPVKLGNVKKDRLSDIWENSPKLREIRNIRFYNLSDQCATCDYKNSCSVCMGNAYLENHGTIAPTRESCMIARAYSACSRNQGDKGG